MDIQTWIGLAVNEAQLLATMWGVPCRVVSVDGRPYVGLVRARPNEVQLTVVDQKVTHVRRRY